jgi:outer membrane protein insertion porin family
MKTDAEDADVEEGLLTILALAWLRDGSNDRLYPTSGAVGRFQIEWGPPGRLSESHFLRGETSHSLYASLGGQVVVASRVGLGLATPTGESVELLPNKKFYAGGMRSMRGFSRRKLGPLNKDGAPLGGEALIEVGTELRFPIVGRLKGAIFIDSGQVWRKREDARANQMEVAVGPSLMVQTPIGPVRADVGLRVTDREKTQPKQAFHVSIGHPF